MDGLVVNLLAGLLVAVFTSTAAYLYGRTRSKSPVVLPRRIWRSRRRHYQYLAGHWILYYVTYSGTDLKPCWMRGEEHLSVQRNGEIRGRTVLSGHPTLKLEYTVYGEVRGGWLLLTDACDDDIQDWATVTIPNLYSSECLVGLWSGQDNTKTLISAPVVLSRHPQSAETLNKLVASARLHFVSPLARPRLHESVALLQSEVDEGRRILDKTGEQSLQETD